MGLDSLHTLTSSRAYGLRVVMTAWEGRTVWAGYDRFSVGPESGNYKMTVTGYDRDSTGTDVMLYHNGMMFTTYDRDNDPSGGNCAIDWKGGWWYKKCYIVNPTGVYGWDAACDGRGIVWEFVHGYKCRYYAFKHMTFTLIP